MFKQEVEERLKQEVRPLAADLSLPPGLEKKMKGAQQGGGYGGSKETQGYTQVRASFRNANCGYGASKYISVTAFVKTGLRTGLW